MGNQKPPRRKGAVRLKGYLRLVLEDWPLRVRVDVVAKKEEGARQLALLATP